MLNHFIKETGYNRKTQRKSASKVKVKTTDGTQMTPLLDFISVVPEDFYPFYSRSIADYVTKKSKRIYDD